jgi:hypothetical protein
MTFPDLRTVADGLGVQAAAEGPKSSLQPLSSSAL